MRLLNDKIAVLYLSQTGREIAAEISAKIKVSEVISVKGDFHNLFAAAWQTYRAVICIMAAGIVVRAAAPLLKDKYDDPCVVVVDEGRRFALSLLSGHIGGGNELAEKVAHCLRCSPVITTASDSLGLTALDLWLKKNSLMAARRSMLTKKSAKLNREKQLRCLVDMHFSGSLPDDIVLTKDPGEADILISHDEHQINNTSNTLVVTPRNLFVGIGCNRNTPVAEIRECFNELLQLSLLKEEWFVGAATIDLKINEKGLVEFARQMKLPLSYYNRERLNTVEDVSYSDAVMKAVGVKGVAEPAAVLVASDGKEIGDLLIKKQKWPNVTMAVSRKLIRLK